MSVSVSQPMSTDAPPLLSQAAVAEFFDVTTRTVRNWDRAGFLHPIRIGRSLRYRRSEVEALGGAPMPPSDEPTDADQ